jgi:acyl carrier protein
MNMNDPKDILAAIYRGVDWINGDLPRERQLSKTPGTPLIGSQSVLDSIRLVSLIVAVEREMEDKLGVTLTLAD